MFKPISPSVDFPKLEEEILKYWKKNKIFEKSITSRPESKKWTFLDGPPFVTGVPHYGSLLSSIPKDVFGRYWTMKGYRVRRVWGWDGHGLPIENKVETALGIKSKKEIEEKVGVKKFIDECKKYVNQTSAEWEWYVDKIGRWVDFKDAYKTWDLDYMESVLWVFKQMYDKGFIYKGLRVSLYCPHCATPISNFEVAMDADNYKEIPDYMTTYKYQLKDVPKTFILAWSTTPWNKIVTPALAVNPKLTYVKVKQGDEYYILAKPTIKILKKEPKWEIVEEFKGSRLIGKNFVPHYDYYKIGEGEKAWKIIGGDFVTAEEGTGVVTIAAYGEEDLKAMTKYNIHIEMHLDEEGNIKSDVPKFGDMYYLKANKFVNEDLNSRGLIYKDEELPHAVPLCWRCHTRLYYAPLDAWFVDVQTLKPLLKKTNEKVNWFPKHFKYGRFLKSLENAPDWNISRNRYWGSPVPVWECKEGHRFVPGSIKELEQASGKKITDLHKPLIDEIKVKCKECGKLADRTPEVLDSWIEAGSASFAERHFPFNKTEKLEDFFPPDFIAEYTGQIRAWFYVLHVIGGALYKSEAFKNVVVEGVILGTDGRKMSKNYGNYPDPKEMLQKYGGDALRLYLMGSPVMKGEDILISGDQYREQVRGILLIFWNVYNFFVSNANADGWKQTTNEPESKHVLDEWILSRLAGNIENIKLKGYEKFDTPEIVGHAWIFLMDLSQWYIRRIRDRVGPSSENIEDKNRAYQTLWFVLTEYCKALAPIIPFITEEIYRNLKGGDSVHLTDWPILSSKYKKNELEVQMDLARQVVVQGHSWRKEQGIKVRMPVLKIPVKLSVSPSKVPNDIWDVVLEELNCISLSFSGKGSYPKNPKKISEGELLKMGQARDIVRMIQEERKKLGTRLDEKVQVQLPEWPKEFEKDIKKRALVKRISQGEFKVVRG